MGKAKDADKKFMTAPEGEEGKTHPKRPRKEGLTRWHRFSLIRQSGEGTEGSESRDTWGAKGRPGKGWEKQTTWDPDGNALQRDEVWRRQVKEAGGNQRQKWRPWRGRHCPSGNLLSVKRGQRN